MKKLHEKEKKALHQQIAIFDGIAFQLIEAWQKLDYRQTLECIESIEAICKKARLYIAEETKIKR